MTNWLPGYNLFKKMYFTLTTCTTDQLNRILQYLDNNKNNKFE